MTLPERTLWSLLRRERLGLRFRRQHAIGPFILDFYCPSAKLCVEVDGPAHAEQAEYDLRRDRWLMDRGIRVLRVLADDVEQRSAVVLASIAQAAAPFTAYRRSPSPVASAPAEDRKRREPGKNSSPRSLAGRQIRDGNVDQGRCHFPGMGHGYPASAPCAAAPRSMSRRL